MVGNRNYLDFLKERSQKSRIYKKYQLTGLILANILEDRGHKALYIRLAKEYDDLILLSLAKRVAEKKIIKNKGAYFMKLIANLDLKKLKKISPRKSEQKKIVQRTLFSNGSRKNRYNRK
jgi:alpha-beta hydrolase superfamily lysophospholipase